MSGGIEASKGGATVEELSERGRLFDQVLSSITDFVYTFDLQGRFTFINKPLLDLWGMKFEEAVGKTFFELPYPAELAGKLQDQIDQVIRTGERVTDETRYDSPLGTIGYYQYIFSPIFGSDGKIEGVAGSTRDITSSRNLEIDRTQAAIALEIERANLAEVVEKAPSFICVLRGPEHIFELSNERYYDLIGRKDVIGKVIREALPEIEGQGFFELLDQVYLTGEPVTGNEVPVFVGPEGAVERRILNFVYQPLRGFDGQVNGIFVHGVEVTDLVNARDELAESRHRMDRQTRLYEAILSNTPDLMYVWDLNHRFTYANEILLKMWGTSREEAIGKNCLELGYEPWHAEMHDREIEQVIATKQPVRGEVPFSGTFGRRMYDYIIVPVIGANGEVEAVAGTTRDITEREQMESQLAQQAKLLEHESRLKDEFLAMLSHELRNPLAPIASAIAVMQKTSSQDENPLRREAIQVIERQVANLTKIVGDLLEVSRVVSGRIRLDLQVVDLVKIVKHAIETTMPEIESRNHTLITHLSSDPLWAHIDPTRIEEVLINILNNAAKYTPECGRIEVHCEQMGDDHLQVRVIDNGIGIEANLLPHIFDLFTQADKSLDRSQGGLGIGLNLASHLAALHGGRIEVQSPPEGRTAGSEFTVILPRIKVDTL